MILLILQKKKNKNIAIYKEIESENNSIKREILLIKNELLNSKFGLTKIANNILLKNNNNKTQIDSEENANNKDIQQKAKKRFYF